MPFKCSVVFNCCWSSLDHRMFLNNIAPGVIWMCSVGDYLSLNHIVLRSSVLHLIIFHCPQLIWILFVFLPLIHCIASRWSTFQGVSRSVDVILVTDFANSIDILLVWQSFYSGINSHTSKIMSIQSLVVEMKSERCQFLKIKLLRSKIQHTLFEIYSPLIVLYFENRNDPL